MPQLSGSNLICDLHAEHDLLAAYRAAPQTIRDIVDTALAPYANKNPAAERGEAM